jgi:3-methylcrotonyl-CoA carboxylase alpha subunit
MKNLKTTLDEMSVKASLEGERLGLTIDGKARDLEVRSFGRNEVLLRDAQGRTIRAIVVRGPGEGEISVAIGGRVRRFAQASEKKKARAHSAHDAALEAPMPGTCREVFVAAGDKVEKGARLVLIEAMKMEHEVRAPRAGTVKAVRCKKGEPVSPGTPLVELDA